MLQDFYIHHRIKPGRFSEALAVPVWSTCLRSLAFSAQTEALLAGDETFAQVEAYRFLLEVLCGLKSPIVGETEVFGQFKQFSQEWLKVDPARAPLIQKILQDVKAIRHAHLLDLGVQSYGSWIRHNLKFERVHFLGAGHLVGEILPYLSKKGCAVEVHTREPGKYPAYNAHALTEKKFDHGALIVAAPMSATEIHSWLDDKVPQQLIDLRDSSSADRMSFTGLTHALVDIFSAIEKTKQGLEPRLEAAQKAIIECSRRASALGIVRPQGWDDLCA